MLDTYKEKQSPTTLISNKRKRGDATYTLIWLQKNSSHLHFEKKRNEIEMSQSQMDENET